MSDTLFLTWRYVVVNRGHIGLLVAIVALAVALPLSLHRLLIELSGNPDSQAQSVAALAAVHGAGQEAGAGGSILDGAVVLVGGTSLLTVTVAFALARRFRRAEMRILSDLGCSRTRIRALLALEILFVVLVGGVFAAVALAVVHGMAHELVRLLFPR